MAKPPKLKLDAKTAMEQHQAASTQSAVDRFAAAEAIISVQPTGLTPPRSEPPPSQLPEPISNSGVLPRAFDPSACVVGTIVSVPLHLIDLNPVSPRHIYTDEEIDKIAKTLPDGQDDAAHGYVENGRVKLIDGGTRYRSAKVTDCRTLDVKIEEAPKDTLELYLRARALNEQRSDTKALDFALSLGQLLKLGAVANQRELMEKVQAPGGGRLTESNISTYMRITRLPERVQRSMCQAPETSTVVALYAVSELFGADQTGDDGESAVEKALDIIGEIKRRKLNSKQIQELVKSKREGPKPRERSSSTPIEIGTHKGQIKTFARKGQIQLEVNGLLESELPEFKATLMKAVENFLRREK